MEVRDRISAESAFDLARSAHPTVDVPRGAFIAFATARIETWCGNPERAADLYLACGCVERIPSAIAEFLSRFSNRIPSYLRQVTRHADVVAEVRQVLMTRCLVGDESNPSALASYSATGSLDGWLRATAVREALALNRRAARHTSNVEGALEARALWADDEISIWKKIYREPVQRAFSVACSQLGPEDRALLRLHYVDNVTTASLAAMYGISRATLIRRMAAARASLLQRVKILLKSGAGIAEHDFESVLRIVKSQLDLRLSVVLEDPRAQS